MMALKQILNLDIFTEARVLTDRQSLQQQMVASVSVIEMPVENFVRPNEMVLSTAIGCSDDPDVFQSFLKDIMACQPAALVLATGRYIHEVPEHIIQLAQTSHFPIIEIPWHIHFADITQTIIESLNEQRQRELEQSENIQQQFLNLILQGANLSGIAQFIFEKTGKPAVITDNSGAIKGTSESSDSLINLWNQQTSSTDPGTHSAEPSYKKSVIHSAGSVQGHILLQTAANTTQLDTLLNHAATAAGLWFLRENAIVETEARLHGDFIWELAKGELTDSWDMIHSRARSLGLDLSLPYVCLTGKVENMKTDEDDQDKKQVIRDILQHIQSLAESKNLHVIATHRQYTLVVYLEMNEHHIVESARLFCRELEEQLHRIPAEATISWGIGENHAGIKQFANSYRAARDALNIGIEQKGPGHITSYGDTRLYRALLQIAHNEEILEMTQQVIGRLLDYSKEKDIDLIHTFNGYVQHQRNTSKTAKALHLHRQSLLYRLQKIESLTGYSFDNPDDLFLIHLCIKLWSAGMVTREKHS